MINIWKLINSVTAWNQFPVIHTKKYAINKRKWLFFDINPTSILFNKENTTLCFTTSVCFLRKEHYTLEKAWCWAAEDQSTVFLASSFTQKLPESSDDMYSSIFMQEKTWYQNFTWSRLDSQEVVNFVLIKGLQWPKLNWNKIQSFL